MKEEMLRLFALYPQAAFVLSLLISVLVAVLGLVPSVFITAANILFFGFWPGTFLSFGGEALGAIVSFWLYRKGFKLKAAGQLQRFPKVAQLTAATGTKAFLLIFSLRMLPFVPSGLVTFAAAIGTVSLPLFVLASSLGKIPALLLEAYAVQQVSTGTWQGKALLAVAGIALLTWLVRKREKV